MPKRKSVKSRTKKVAKKTAKVAKKTAKRSSGKAAKKRSTKRRPARAASVSRKAAATTNWLGAVTHTELASADPAATRMWCEQVLGWRFGDAMPTPSGPYHMWRVESGTGGGIRANNPPEAPGSIPYVEVADIQVTFANALTSGGAEMVPPMQLPGGMGWIAIVGAPGGVAIGFWAKG